MENRLLFKNKKVICQELQRTDKTGKTGDNGWHWVDIGETQFSLRYLLTTVIFEDVTFGDFWNWLIADSSLRQTLEHIYYEHLGGSGLDKYIAESLAPQPKKLEDDLDFLEVYWHLESFIWGETKPQTSADFYSGFHGWGIWPKFEGEEPHKGGIAIELTSLNKLMPYPIKLNHDLTAFIWGRNTRYREVHMGNMEFTLNNVIEAIFREITWH